jgi:hypothetical protein
MDLLVPETSALQPNPTVDILSGAGDNLRETAKPDD